MSEETTNQIQNSLGSYLSKQRKIKNIDLKTIAITTRINFKILQDIEEDKRDQLPSRTYLRGFVKSFAKAVDADVDMALTLLDDSLDIKPTEVTLEEPTQTQVEKTNFTNMQDLRTRERSVNPKHVVLGLSLVAVLGAIAFGSYHFFKSTNDEANVQLATATEASEETLANETTTAETEPTQTKEEPLKAEFVEKQAEPTPEPVAVEKVEVKPEPVQEEVKVEEAPVEVKEETNEEPVVVEAEKKEEEKPEAPKEKQPFFEKDVKFSPMPFPLFSLSSDNEKLNQEEVFPSNIKEAYSNSNQNYIYIKASNGDTWLSYKNGENPVKSFVLKQGRNLYIRGNDIRLFLGRLNAVEIMHNNKYVQATSRSGVKSLVFPQDLAKKYKLPLFIYNPQTNIYFTEEEFLKKRDEYLNSL